MWLFIIDIKNGKLNGAVNPAPKLDRNPPIMLKYSTRIGLIQHRLGRRGLKPRNCETARLQSTPTANLEIAAARKKNGMQGGTPI